MAIDICDYWLCSICRESHISGFAFAHQFCENTVSLQSKMPKMKDIQIMQKIDIAENLPKTLPLFSIGINKLRFKGYYQ
jgi:hypothetical protein